MKQFIVILAVCFLVAVPVWAAETWQQNFFNTVQTEGYDAALINAIQDGVPLEDVCQLSSQLGFDKVYILAKVVVITESMGMDSTAVLAGLLNSDFGAGVDAVAVTSLAASNIESAVAAGVVRAPSSNEVAMNFARFYGDMGMGEGAPGGEQGLGFGDEPGLGFGDLVMGEVGFGSGGNIEASPSAF
ncbi:hypothetical protein OOT00_13865 [Desulfobotulus sp. H1]|uniref:Uncharacterized protein n=1 Tax=Desulfobotulus pelophilus TaxID=2823377 RepID=A0ABT3NCZ8_9BACT|nr:hypothetical protein [Desulfobotulus pelophilus]MCW7755071.1 hypothetical protein [Desulfobotulus pelophilus]